ncbi:MAG TPA: hypothetical protein GX497_11730 [Bacillus bacterium]|nr:hypothetical protein [Bacillus sp. (in: firmicutes)]
MSLHLVKRVTDSVISIIGKTEAKSVVKLYINEKYMQQTKADKNGNYKFKITKLSAGTKIKVTSTDEAGYESVASTTTVID